jgi:hypothetical protein
MVGVLVAVGVLIAVDVTVGAEVSVGVDVMVGVLVTVGVAVVENLFIAMGRYTCPSLMSSFRVVLSLGIPCSPCEAPCAYLAPSKEPSGFNDVLGSVKR